MVFSKVTEYFYASASTIETDRAVFDRLANDEYMQAFEEADDACRRYRQQGTDAEIAAAMTTLALVNLAFEEADQANELAEGALNLAKKAGKVEVEAAAMNVIAQVMINWAPEEGVQRARDALDVAKGTGGTHLRACVHHTLARALLANASGNQALVVAHDMATLFAGTDATGEGCALLCVAQLQRDTGDHRGAMLTAKSAGDILDKAGNVSRQALSVRIAASAALSSASTASEGFDLADKALALFESAGDKKAALPLKIEYASAKLQAESYVEAEDWAEEAQAEAKKNNDLYNEADAAQVLATVRLAIAVEEAKGNDEAETAAATEAARDALQLYRRVGNRRGEARAMQKLAEVRYQSGAGDMAKTAAEDATAMFRELGDTNGEAGAVLLTAHVMHKEGQLDGAKRSATKAFTLYQHIADNDGMESCTEFLDKIKVTQTEKTRTEKATKKTVSDTGLVKLVNSVEESTHLLSYFADMNEDEDTELGEFDLTEWGSAMNMLKIQS